jgi:hypothetical protein
MTEIKPEVGKQYKTRGGWRCVVVDKDSDGEFLVWHKDDNETWFHIENGKFDSDDDSDNDIIAEWSEPKTHEVWVSLYSDSKGLYPMSWHPKPNRTDDMLALKKITITEGEFDND